MSRQIFAAELKPFHGKRPPLTPQQIRRVRDALADGVWLIDLARRFDCSTGFIRSELERVKS